MLFSLLSLFGCWSFAQERPVDIRARMTMPCQLQEQSAQTASFFCRAGDDVFEGQVQIVLPASQTFEMPSGGGLPDPEEAVWSFDNQSDGQRELIVHTYRDGEVVIADLYDRRSDLSRFPSRCCDASELTRLEPTVTVRAENGWRISDMDLNYDLDIEIDGDVYAIFGGSEKLERFLELDGEVDYRIRVRDTDDDGRPDYEVRRALVPQETSQRIYRSGQAVEQTAITVNVEDDEAPLQSWIPWPHLGPETYGFLTNSALANNYPAIQVDFDEGRIVAVGEFVRSRGNDNQWFIYSFNDLDRGAVNLLDFESPFAFYDLFPSEIELPELAVRVTFTEPFSSTLYQGGFPHPATGVRYSWIQRQDGAWRKYKLGLLSDHAPQSEVEIDGYTIRSFAPYEDLPEWIVSKEWSGATFVSEMRPQDALTGLGEGLNSWDVDTISNRDFFEYALGIEDDRVAAASGTDDIPEGLRGEYALGEDLPVELYQSPVDGELHLANASGGVWNQGGGVYLSYGNLDADRFIDAWTRFFRQSDRAPSVDATEQAAITTEEQMLLLPGHLLYSSREGIWLKRVELPSVLFETSPPTDPDGWSALEARLGADERTRPPRTVRQMFDGIEAPVGTRSSASLREASFSADGTYALLVEVFEGGDPISDPIFGVPMAVGMNVVRFDPATDAWSVEPFQPGPITATLSPERAQRLRPLELTVELTNESNFERVAEASIRIGDEVVRSWRELRIPASLDGDRSIVRVRWSPRETGVFPVSLVFGGREFPVGGIEVMASVASSSRVDVAQSVAPAPGWLLAFLLVVVTFVAAGLVGALNRKATS